MPEDAPVHVPNFNASREVINARRRGTLPADPEDLSVVDFAVETWRSLVGEYLLFDNRASATAVTGRILVFARDSDLKELAQSRFLLKDGTFRKCAKMFKQIYTYHGEYHGEIFPFVWAYLQTKTTYSLLT